MLAKLAEEHSGESVRTKFQVTLVTSEGYAGKQAGKFV